MNTGEREFSKVLENQDQMEQLENVVKEHGQKWAKAADEWVRENPYLAMAAALAVGCAVAALISRSSRD